MTTLAQVLDAVHDEAVAAACALLVDHEAAIIAPSLFGVRLLDGTPEVLTYEFLDARMHLYAMRAAYRRDGLAGVVFVSLGEAVFTDGVVPALMTVRATPDTVCAEVRELAALRAGDRVTALPAPPQAVMAYEDVFTDVPLPTIRQQITPPGIVARNGRPVVTAFRRPPP